MEELALRISFCFPSFIEIARRIETRSLSVGVGWPDCLCTENWSSSCRLAPPPLLCLLPVLLPASEAPSAMLTASLRISDVELVEPCGTDLFDRDRWTLV